MNTITPELLVRYIGSLVAVFLMGYLFQSWMRKKFPTLPPPKDLNNPPSDAKEEDSGLKTRVTLEGRGNEHPKADSTVTVHYTGWETNGLMFDSSVTRGTPATFKVNQLIKGWQEGLALMVEGEHRRMWIPAELAYGHKNKKGPSGLLVFEVCLIKIHDLDTDTTTASGST